jgi:hypothetical protein
MANDGGRDKPCQQALGQPESVLLKCADCSRSDQLSWWVLISLLVCVIARMVAAPCLILHLNGSWRPILLKNFLDEF